jgi:Flp pilus assembly protein TadG
MARISKWQNLLRRFGASQKGSVAIMFALSAIPVLLAVGASVDFVRYTALSTELQSALDAAALSAAASTDTPDSQRVALAKATFMENANNGEISKATVDFKIKGGAVLASAKYEMPTTFMRLASVDAMQIPAITEVSIPEGKTAEIALVLDYSGSMKDSTAGGTKYVAMRNAAKKLINDLNKAKAKGITMMTIAYDLYDSTTRNRLRDCSTDPAKHFFVATDTSAVASAFDNIRNAITAQVFVSR